VAIGRSLFDRVAARPAPLGLGLRFFGGLLLAPLLATLVPEIGRVVPRPVGGIDTLATADLVAEEAALLDALRAEREELFEVQREARGEDGSGRLRVAFLRSRMSGAMWPLFSLADADADIVLDGHVASINFAYHVGRPRTSLLTALGVTHVLWDGSVEDD